MPLASVDLLDMGRTEDFRPQVPLFDGIVGKLYATRKYCE